MQKVEYVDHMGSDLSVVNAARVSFSKTSDWEFVDDGAVKWKEGADGELEADWSKAAGLRSGSGLLAKLPAKDKKLIKYLADNGHWTPFGHCFVSLRIKAPIFVARQLVKHQIGLVWNETSRRYVDSEPEFYTPKTWRKRADNVKQGSSDECITAHQAWSALHIDTYWDEPNNLTGIAYGNTHIFDACLDVYNELLDHGVCPEQARMVLPQSMMTEWIWSGSLAAFARVCNLRLDPHTQDETRDVAAMIDAIIAPLFPVSWEALRK